MTTNKQQATLIATAGHWFGEADCPAFAWVSAASGSDRLSGILILPPLAYEYWTTQHSLQTLQERLAGEGHLVLKLDYLGTGDAAGDLWDADIFPRWEREVRTAVEQLRSWGARKLTLIGLRFGALLALHLAQSLDVDQVIAWLPIIHGRRYVRELRLMASQEGENIHAGSVARNYLAGVVLTEALLAEISELNLDGAPVDCKALVIDRLEMPSAIKYVDSIRNQSPDIEYTAQGDAATMLDVSTEEAGIAQNSINVICERLRESSDPAGNWLGMPATTTSARWSAGGTPIVERHLRLAEVGLSAIETAPTSAHSGITVVFLNSGSEKHVGPGRAWVEFARALASRGHTSVRADFQGWGESPDNGYRPGRPYDLHGVTDTHQIVAALRKLGHARIVLAGVCAGAWIALRDCGALRVQGIVAFNPQIYFDLATDPVFPTMAVSHIWYNQERTKADWQTRRGPTRHWLEHINELPYPVDFWFERGDQGLEYIEQELPDLMASLHPGSMLSIATLPQLDHSMHRHWLRAEAIEAIEHLISRARAVEQIAKT